MDTLFGDQMFQTRSAALFQPVEKSLFDFHDGDTLLSRDSMLL
jgi:hypothetical protein